MNEKYDAIVIGSGACGGWASMQLAQAGMKVLMLDGRKRLDIVTERPMGNLRNSPVNHLDILYRDDLRRRRLSQAVFEAFGFYLVIDNTSPATLSVAMARTLLNNPVQEKSHTEETIQYFRGCTPNR